MSLGKQKELSKHRMGYYAASHKVEDELHRLTNGERLSYLWDEVMYCTLTVYDWAHSEKIPHNIIERSSTPDGLVFHINVGCRDVIYVYDICKSDADSVSVDYGVDYSERMTVMKPKSVKIFSVMDYALKLLFLNREDSEDEQH